MWGCPPSFREATELVAVVVFIAIGIWLRGIGKKIVENAEK